MLTRLGSNKTDEEINSQLAMIVHTTSVEAALHEGTSYLDCFKDTDLRRTEIACVAFAGQVLSGSSFAYRFVHNLLHCVLLIFSSPTYFFTTAGIASDKAYQLNLGTTSIAFVGTCLSWILITFFGRRTLYMAGQAVLAAGLLLIGILNAASSTPGSLWAQAAFCILWSLTYALTVGPIAYAIVSETSSVRLRPLSVVLARNAYQLTNIVSQILQSYFMNPTGMSKTHNGALVS